MSGFSLGAGLARSARNQGRLAQSDVPPGGGDPGLGDPLKMAEREIWGVRAMWKIARQNIERMRKG